MKQHGILLILCVLFLSSVLQADAQSADPRLTPVVFAYRRAKPAVVNISTEKLVTVRFGLFGSDLFDDIFPSPLRRRVPVQNLGSGFLINHRGFIVTNAHVVRLAEKIAITLADGSQYPAKVISSDPDIDLAVLKIDPPAGTKLSYLPLGRSDDLMVGETVIAIGNAMGYANSLTTGVISATGRTLSFRNKVKIEGLIQTDTPINPGNSGGPLLNIKGELIGINTAIRADAQNIGFAIPVDRLAEELVHLLDFERLNRVIFGAAVAQRHLTKGDELYVADVRKGTPAHGKLRPGDRILELNGVPMKQITDYACAAVAIRPDQTINLKIMRGDKKQLVRVIVVSKPRPEGKAIAHRLFGLTLRTLTPQLARDLRLAVGRGLLVVGVEGGSIAEKLGLELGDVVFQVGKWYVRDLDNLGILLEDIKPGQRIQIGIVRGNVRAWASITAGEYRGTTAKRPGT